MTTGAEELQRRMQRNGLGWVYNALPSGVQVVNSGDNKLAESVLDGSMALSCWAAPIMGKFKGSRVIFLNTQTILPVYVCLGFDQGDIYINPSFSGGPASEYITVQMRDRPDAKRVLFITGADTFYNDILAEMDKNFDHMV